MPLVKICGITRPEDAEDAFSLGADFLGLVFAKSLRQITLSRAEEIIDAVSTFHNFVGVFQDTDLEEVKCYTDSLGLDYVQLHGKESPDYCQVLAEDGLSVIKAIHVEKTICKEDLKPYNVFAFIFDSACEGRSGGTGRAFNWNLVSREIWQSHKVFLSGGLNSENLDDAIDATHPFAVDVSSGVEVAPGIKDFQRVSEFIRRAKQDLR